MSIFKFITASQLRKVLSAIHQRFIGVENNLETLERNGASKQYVDDSISGISTTIEDELKLKANTSDVVQSDWEENDSTNPAYIDNKPSIISGTGNYGVIVGNDDEQHSSAKTHAITISGDANATTYSYSSEDVIVAGAVKLRGILMYDGIGHGVKDMDTTNHTITFYRTLSTDAISNASATIYVYQKLAIGENSYVGGRLTIASGECSIAENFCAKATGNYSHAEGSMTLADGVNAHAEGALTKAIGSYSHAEGQSTVSEGTASHAEGSSSNASGLYSHAEGYYTIAASPYQHAQGKYNIEDTNNTYAHIVGNGIADNARSNAHTLDWSGNGWYAGKVSAGTVANPATVTNANDLTTKAYVDSVVSGTGGSSTLVDLTDTTISSAADGQVLTYDSTSNKWINEDIPSDNFIVTITRYGTGASWIADKTFTEIKAAYDAGKKCYALMSQDVSSFTVVLPLCRIANAIILFMGFGIQNDSSDYLTYYIKISNSNEVTWKSIYLNGRNITTDKVTIAPRNFDTSNVSFASTATQAYSVGDLFWRNYNVLAKATANISSGDTLTENTNYVTTTIDNELKLKADLSDVLTKTNTTSYTPSGDYNPATKKYVDDAVDGLTSNTGTVTQVTAGTGLSIGSTAGGNLTTTGTINHTNSVTAQTTQAIYPITIDAQGHISAYGTAVTPLTAASTLDATKLSGTVPTACLPSYVDDVLEYTAKSNFPATGETGKIYVDTTTNLTYRWSGSAYVEISPSLALGTTSSTAFRGDYGNSAYTHAVTNKGSAFASGLYKITTNSEGHVTAATAVVKADITGLGIPAQDTTYTFDGTYNASTNKAATVSTVTDAISNLSLNLSGNTIQLKQGNTVLSSITLPVYNGGVSS